MTMGPGFRTVPDTMLPGPSPHPAGGPDGQTLPRSPSFFKGGNLKTRFGRSVQTEQVTSQAPANSAPGTTLPTKATFGPSVRRGPPAIPQAESLQYLQEKSPLAVGTKWGTECDLHRGQQGQTQVGSEEKSRSVTWHARRTPDLSPDGCPQD